MINKSTFLLKIHYFLLFGGIASVEQYGINYTMPLGASLTVMSTLGIVVLAFILLVKPALSLVVDTFPRSRRPIFVCTVALLCISAFLMVFVPAFKNAPSYSTAWVAYGEVNVSAQWENRANNGQDGIMSLEDFRSCDRTTPANSSDSHFLPWSEMQMILPHNETCKMQEGADCYFEGSLVYLQLQRTGDPAPGYSTYSVSAPAEARVQCSNDTTGSRLKCGRGEYVSDDCGGSVVYTAAFWCYAVLFLAREFTTTTTISFTDACSIDTIGQKRNYGWQRVWGVVGWGLSGPLVAAVISYLKGAATVKRHSNAFAFAAIFFALDVIVAFFIKAPEMQRSGAAWPEVKRLMSNSKFIVFLFFTLMNGFFNWTAYAYVSILQWQMLLGTPELGSLPYISLVLVLVRFLSELPWMYNADRLVKKFGARKLFSVIFMAHTLRLGLNAVVGQWGPVWGTLIVEILDGPVYGLGYPLVVLYARQFTTPGLSNTVQSFTNNAYDMLSLGIGSAISAPLYLSLGVLNMLWLYTLGVLNMLWLYTLCAAATVVLHVICHLLGVLLKNDGAASQVGDVMHIGGSDAEELHKLEDS